MDATFSGTLEDALTLSHGFRPTPSGPLGVLHGIPVRVSQERSASRNQQKVTRLWLGTSSLEAASAASEALRTDRKALPAKLLGNQVVDGGLIVDLPAKLRSAPAAESVAVVEAIVQRVAAVPGNAPVPADGADLVTVDGVPRWLTAADRQAIERDAAEAAAAYEATEQNLPAGLVGAAVGATVTAVVWAALYAYAEYSFWLVAIAGGALTAFLAVKAARRITTPLRVAVFVATLLGVLVGEILGLTLVGQQLFGVFDPVGAASAYVEFAGEAITDVLFALGGGIVGAVVGLQKAAPPRFERDIDA